MSSDPAIQSVVRAEVKTVEAALLDVMNAELRRMLGQGLLSSVAVEVLIAAAAATTVDAMRCLVADGSQRTAVADLVVAQMCQAMGLPQDRLGPGSMMQ
jgi:hypothetical protein